MSAEQVQAIRAWYEQETDGRVREYVAPGFDVGGA